MQFGSSTSGILLAMTRDSMEQAPPLVFHKGPGCFALNNWSLSLVEQINAVIISNVFKEPTCHVVAELNNVLSKLPNLSEPTIYVTDVVDTEKSLHFEWNKEKVSIEITDKEIHLMYVKDKDGASSTLIADHTFETCRSGSAACEVTLQEFVWNKCCT